MKCMANFPSSNFHQQAHIHCLYREQPREAAITAILPMDFIKIQASPMYMYCQLVLTSLGTMFKFGFTNSGIMFAFSLLFTCHLSFFPSLQLSYKPFASHVHSQLSCLRFLSFIADAMIVKFINIFL